MVADSTEQFGSYSYPRDLKADKGSLSCAGAVWEQMRNVLNDCLDRMSVIFHEISNRTGATAAVIRNALVAALEVIWQSIASAWQAIWKRMTWMVDTFVFPFIMSGINIVGYFFDKFIYGSPALRPYLHDGLIASDIPESWRKTLRNNTGVDIYENMGPVLDNFFGILGLGIGALNFLNHLATSIYKNFLNYCHSLGNDGVFGEQGFTEDKRGVAVKIVFGALSVPIIAVPLLITNGFDGVCAYFKNYEKTIKKPLILATGLIAGSLLAIPTFIARKTFKGLYNCTIRSCVAGESYLSMHTLNGALNVLTFGLFGAVKKVFKACTGYTDRFGFPPKENPTNAFNEVENKFRVALKLASKGEFPTVTDGQGQFRSLMRLFYGMKHKVEEILKTIHHAYRQYATELMQQHTEQTDVAYHMNSFFQSQKYTDAKNSITLRDGEKTLIDDVEAYLRPV